MPEGKTKKRKSDEAGLSVKEHLNNVCKEVVESVQQHAELLAGNLRAEFESSKAELETLVEKASEETAAATKRVEKVKVILVVIGLTSSDAGEDETPSPYLGKTFTLRPPKRGALMVGRSSGKKFKKSGLSLAKDDTASTTHGKVHIHRGVLSFTDLDSTNGTYINGEKIEPREPTEIKHGDTIRIGANIMRVSLE